MALVQSIMPHLYVPATKIGMPGSSGRLFLPMVNGINHLGGHMLGNLRCAVTMDANGEDSSYNHQGSFYTWRHPNCDYLVIHAELGEVKDSPFSIQVQAGTGAAQIHEAWEAGDVDFLVPWHGDDTGLCEVTISCDNCALRSFVAWDLSRNSLSAASDHALEHTDGTYRLAGFQEGYYLIESATAGMGGIIAQAENAWSDCHRQYVAWFDPYDGRMSSLGRWDDPFATDFDWKVRARLKDAVSDSYGYATVYVHTKCDAGVTDYDWRLRSDDDEVGGTGLSNTTYAWDSATTLAIKNGEVDTLAFETQVNAGSGDVYVNRISVIETDP